MTEKEIRGIIKQVFARLDQCARRGVRKVVLPTMLGAGLALSGGCDGRNVPAEKDATPQTDSTAQTDGGSQQLDSQGNLMYMAPDPDGGPAPAYMAPEEDAGAVIEYMAPDPDSGPVYPPYMAPDSGEPTIDYMAPDPDGGPQP